MSQLKNLVITIMYLYVFVQVLCSGNYVSVMILFILLIYFYKRTFNTENVNKKTKNGLILQREQFINFLTHDLRIPIIAQIRALELIRNGKLGVLNEPQIELIKQTEESCKYIFNLMSLMINTYRLENNSFKLIYEKFNISDVIISCFNELVLKASEKNITFEYLGKDKNLNINADKEELKKVIYNFLSSTITNANFGEKITIRISSSNNKVHLNIQGNKNNRTVKNTFVNPYYTPVGENIKMEFCKKIIEYHKGKIISNPQNNSFSLEIPQFVI